jgi:hypothetical protein
MRRTVVHGVTDLAVVISGEDMGVDERAELAQRLYAELRDVDFIDVSKIAESVLPAGAKSGGAVVLGALAVTIVPPVVAQFVDVVCSWLRRQHREVEVEIGGVRLKGDLDRGQRDLIVAAVVRQIDAGRPVD